MKSISFTRTSKRIRYLGINLTNEVKDMQYKKLQYSSEKFREDKNNG